LRLSFLIDWRISLAQNGAILPKKDDRPLDVLFHEWASSKLRSAWGFVFVRKTHRQQHSPALESGRSKGAGKRRVHSASCFQYLFERALLRVLVGAPSQEFGAMPEAIADT
jgi:hypothetical protein